VKVQEQETIIELKLATVTLLFKQLCEKLVLALRIIM